MPRHASRTRGLATALVLFIGITAWAAPATGTAHAFAGTQRLDGAGTPIALSDTDRTSAPAFLPNPVRFEEVDGRGLVVAIWVNGSGPYTFAIDTGAGATLISERVARGARVETSSGTIPLAGLSGQSAGLARRAANFMLAAGGSENRLPSSGDALVATNIPEGLDGILDPTQAYWPLGFVLDLPGRQLRAFDPRSEPVRLDAVPHGGAVMSWLDDENWRPFVQLGDRRALIDTGSRFGLAVDETAARSLGVVVEAPARALSVADLGGGRVLARRAKPTTVHVGSLQLVGIPTDVLSGVAPGAPILLGREALRPFELAFDPRSKLIRFAPGSAAGKGRK